MCKQSFQCIRELCYHLEIAHITLEPDEHPKNSKMIKNNIVENTKKITSTVPHVLDTQNIERSNHLLHSQNLECPKRHSCSNTSNFLEIPNMLQTSVETVNIGEKVNMFTSKKITLEEVPKRFEIVYLQHNCSICSKSFLHEERLKLHLLEHSSVDILECPACNEKFNATPDFKSHVELHRTFKLCVLCNELVSTKLKFIDHMHMQHRVQSPSTLDLRDPKTRRHVCKHCGEKFVEKKSLLSHTMHYDESRIVCHVCGKTQASKFRLKYHLTQSACNKRKHCCPHCEKQFTSTTGLHYHSRVHTGVLPPKAFVCALCGKTFETAWIFKMHMASHNGERPRPFLCTVCSKTFTLATRLKEHMAWHSDDRPYACQVCPAPRGRFKRKSLLNKHMKIHSKQPYHVCNVCSKGFNCRDNLQVHMRTHSGDRPYQCTECAQSFPHRGTLKKHLKSHSN